MKKILLAYSPFCTPVIPPYSISNIYTFLKNNLKNHSVETLDLNIEYHNLEFSEFKDFYKKFDLETYEEKTKEFQKQTSENYSKNNKFIVKGENPDHFQKILDTKNRCGMGQTEYF